MATEAATIEAARSRIQRLVEQIAALSKAEISSEEFFGKFLERVISATDAKGGAVWLVGSRAQDNKSEFQLCAQIDFASSLFGSDEGQRTTILKILTDVVRNQNAVILNPTHTDAADIAPRGGSVNKTPYAFLHVPLHLNGQAGQASASSRSGCSLTCRPRISRNLSLSSAASRLTSSSTSSPGG